MYSEYKFFSNQFGVSSDRIDLLRSSFCYDSIEFHDVTTAKIRTGREYKNWKIMILAGALMIAFAINHINGLVQFFNSEGGGTYYVESLIVPFFPILSGVLLILLSFRKTVRLELFVQDKIYWFSLRKFKKDGSLIGLQIYLKEKLKNISIE